MGTQNELPANPLDQGSDVHSVESTAQGFSDMLAADLGGSDNPKGSARRSRSRREDEDDNAAAADDGQSDEEADEGNARKSPAEDRDPILDADGDAEDGEDEDEDDGEDEGEDDAEDDDNSNDDDDDWTSKEVEVVVDGKKEKITVAEALKGYSREADYRKKTANLARERDEVVEFAEEVVAVGREYAEKITTYTALIDGLRPSQAEMDALLKADPENFIEVRNYWNSIEAKAAEAKAELEKVQKQEADTQNKNYVRWLKQEDARLMEKVPALTNPKRAKQFRELIFAYGKEAGFDEKELARTADHRQILTLYKAARYDEIMKARKKGTAEPKKSEPKNSSSSRPRDIRTQRGKPNNKFLRAADARLERSGRQEDAAEAFTRDLELDGYGKRR